MTDIAPASGHIDRAYSLLQVKSFDEERRIITGLATSPSLDRQGDIVEPRGARFSLPIPFLWQHDSAQPIGHVRRANVTADGIEVEVHLVKVDEPGTLKDRLDECWQSIRAGLVRGLSIGFRALEGGYERLKTGGIHYQSWEWMELSAVTLAANASASITAIKAADQLRAPASEYELPDNLDDLSEQEQIKALAKDGLRRWKQLWKTVRDQSAEGKGKSVQYTQQQRDAIRMMFQAVFIEMRLNSFMGRTLRRELEKRVAALESKASGLKYVGVWDESSPYQEGNFVSWGGSVWHANVGSKGVRPGDGNVWQLAVKRGRDGKDSR